VSKGEGCERHIEVFKQSDATNSVTSDGLSSHTNITDVSSPSSVCDNDFENEVEVESHVLDVKDMQVLSLNEHVNSSQQSREAIVRTSDVAEHVGSNNVMETADLLSDTSSTVSTLCCSNCGRQILNANYQLHLLHCKPLAAKSTSKKGKDKSSNKVT